MMIARAIDDAHAAPPKTAEGFAAIAQEFLRQGRGPEALAAWCRALEIDPALAAGFHGAGQALELMGGWPGALASYRHAADVDPALAGPAGSMALAALRDHRPQEARAFAEAALARDPAEPSARTALGRLALDANDPAAALAWLEPAARRDDLIPTRSAVAQRALADALDALGRTDEAFDHYAAAAMMLSARHAEGCAGPTPLSGLDLSLILAKHYSESRSELWRPAPARKTAARPCTCSWSASRAPEQLYWSRRWPVTRTS